MFQKRVIPPSVPAKMQSNPEINKNSNSKKKSAGSKQKKTTTIKVGTNEEVELLFPDTWSVSTVSFCFQNYSLYPVRGTFKKINTVKNISCPVYNTHSNFEDQVFFEKKLQLYLRDI